MGSVYGLLKRAYDEVGYIEKASSSSLDSKEANKGTANYTKYARDVNKAGLNGCQGQAWCATFQFWLEMQEFGVEEALTHFYMSNDNYCAYNCFETFNKFLEHKATSLVPQVGDLVVFTQSHIGRVVSVSGNNFKTIEGNTSANKYDRNGGMVKEKSYTVGDAKIKGFCHIDYSGESKQESTPQQEISKSVVNNVSRGQNWLNENYESVLKKNCGGLLEVDGSYGSKTRASCVAVWKDLMNRRYGTNLDPSNSNFLSSCKTAAKKANIKKGDSGTFTYVVQLILSAKGYYSGEMDAHFGAGTKGAVSSFQSARGLSVDGIVGSNTWYSLFNS